MKTPIFFGILLAGLVMACESNTNQADAYGNFEAREVMVAAEASGPLLFLRIEEGAHVEEGELVGLVDTMPLHLQREQLKARLQAIRRKTQNAQPQIDILLSQKNNLEREQRRLEDLLREEAVPSQKVDDINGQIDVLKKRIVATRDQIQTANRSVLSEIEPLEAQIRILNDRIERCSITNPLDGQVLLQLVEPEEMAMTGKPLYKVADLKELTLRAYVSGAQLAHIKLGQEVDVWIDADKDSMQRLIGTVTWIADEAEFTPKIVQTKDERVNLVYAVKVKVPNDGRLKIGMPGEITFMPEKEEE